MKWPNPHAPTQCAATPGTWIKIGADVAWGAKDNSHGTLTLSSKVCGNRVKFVHKSGSVSCGYGVYSVEVMPA